MFNFKEAFGYLFKEKDWFLKFGLIYFLVKILFFAAGSAKKICGEKFEKYTFLFSWFLAGLFYVGQKKEEDRDLFTATPRPDKSLRRGLLFYSSNLGFSISSKASSGEVPAMRSTSLSIFFSSLFEEL